MFCVFTTAFQFKKDYFCVEAKMANDETSTSEGNYYQEMSMALVILALLINVGLLIRIRYGREVITNLTCHVCPDLVLRDRHRYPRRDS